MEIERVQETYEKILVQVDICIYRAKATLKLVSSKIINLQWFFKVLKSNTG